MSNDEVLTPAAAAALLGVHPSTLRRWADDGLVPHLKTPTGQRRYRRSAIDAVLSSGPAREAS